MASQLCRNCQKQLTDDDLIKLSDEVAEGIINSDQLEYSQKTSSKDGENQFNRSSDPTAAVAAKSGPKPRKNRLSLLSAQQPADQHLQSTSLDLNDCSTNSLALKINQRSLLLGKPENTSK